MNRLLRDIAPLTKLAWDEIEREASRTLKVSLAARRIVDFTGPKGWSLSAVDTAQAEAKIAEQDGMVRASVRRVQPLIELRRPFEIPRATLDAIDRGARDADLDPVVEAAHAIALAEDRIVFHGYPSASVIGIVDGADNAAMPIGENYENFPALVVTALARLRDDGVGGPYAIALGTRSYTGLTETTKEGYPILQHIQRLIEGPLVWAPALDGAAILSLRGDDFELIVGQDLSLGYLSHDLDKVTLYLEETLTFRLLSPQAAVPLVYRAAERTTSRPAGNAPATRRQSR